MSDQHLVIVGAGPAGGTAAVTLREEGFAGRVTLIGAEPHAPYIRPPLSKQYLRGESPREDIFLVEPTWYADHDVELMSGTTVTALHPAEHRIQLADRKPVPYDSLLLATGSTPRALPLDGAGLPGVHLLRTVEDSDALRERLAAGGARLVVIGSGWIGMEVAASARLLSNDVTILDRGPVPLAGAIGTGLGSFFAETQVHHGTTLRRSVTVRAIAEESGRAAGVVLDDGEIIPADVVLVAIGAAPDVALARAAGLDVAGGVLVDERLATSAPDVYAVGDIANALHPAAGVRIRSEHLSNALKGGKAAARIMLGQDVRYDDLPTFVSEQFETLQFAGYAPLMDGARVVTRGEPASRSFSTFWLADGRAVAGVHVNVADREKAMQALIRSGRPVDPARLADPSIPLDRL